MTAVRKTHNRGSLIKLIHIARRDVAGLKDEGTYRAMLLAKTGKSSCRDMRDDQLQDVLDHLKKSGFKIQQQGRQLADDAQSKMIRGLWLELADMGVVKNKAESALAAFVKRMTHVEALQWLSGKQASQVIEHLKQWRDRSLKGDPQ